MQRSVRSDHMANVVRLPPRGRYLAHEVGRLAGVSGHVIGQWARRGLIQSSHGRVSGQRIYSFQDAAEAMAVHELEEMGYPAKDIREASDAVLHERPEAFDRLGVNVSAHVHLLAVVDPLVGSELAADFGVRAVLVGVEHR